ncbi:MAG: hypothetical protein M1831_002879 [Alyxoria varia]|nr:MAG: hypothetical protein M1831_002879 [Alyxoria varia]
MGDAYGGDDRGPTVLGVTWAMSGLAIIIVFMRILSRTRFSNYFGVDDGLMLFALAVNIAYAGALTAGVDAGFGKHFEVVSPSDRPLAVFRVVTQTSIGVWTFALPKLAIVALLQRLLNLRKLVLIVCWSSSAILVAGCAALSLLWFLQCKPVPHQWDPSVGGACLDPMINVNLSYFCVAFSGFLDFAFALIPPFTIFRLNMPLYKRIVLSAALGGGTIAGIIAFYKLSLVRQIEEFALIDPTYADVPLQLWTIAEVNILVVAASLPTIGPFLRFVGSSTSKYISRQSKKRSMSFRSATNWSLRGEKKRMWWGNTLGSSKGVHPLSSQQHDEVPMVDVESDAAARPLVPWQEALAPPHDQQRLPRGNEILKTVEVEASHEDARSRGVISPTMDDLGLQEAAARSVTR